MALYKYAWSFSTGYNPTELSCITTSVESAREQIVERLRRITEARAEFNSLKMAPVSESVAKARRDAIRESIDVDAFIGPYTSSVMDFTEGFMIHDDSDSPMTVKDYILHTDPKVTPFQCVSLRIALDG
jgi:hypothetical protein